MKDEIIHFLEKNLIGKILFTDKVTYTLGNGKLEGVYNDQMTFSNLVKTENGFKFNMTTLTHELIYNLDEKGVRTTVAKDYTGTSEEKYKSIDRLYALCFYNSSRSNDGSSCMWYI